MSYGFWLGDAFASGGSVGYDHKAMGITAKGAWESVKRHFRELGRRHAERGVHRRRRRRHVRRRVRQRDAALAAHPAARGVRPPPRLRRPGPGRGRELRRARADVRAAALVVGRLRPRRRSARVAACGRARRSRCRSGRRCAPRWGIAEDVTELSPPELIAAILRAPADLLWNGGIGTYVKASTESHADAGDKTNDAVRADGDELRVKVVGEGGNLGLTQRGRIEFARAGGKINTDAIDNSAGVDCSDHEVNIKILLDRLVAAGELDREAAQRPARRDDRRRGRAGAGTTTATRTWCSAWRGRTPRRWRTSTPGSSPSWRPATSSNGSSTCCPTRRSSPSSRPPGTGLSSPELATLLAHTKLDLTTQVLASDLPDTPAFAGRLPEYFPAAVRDRFPAAVRNHPLRREIVTTMLVNEMVDGGRHHLRLPAGRGALGERGRRRARLRRGHRGVRPARAVGADARPRDPDGRVGRDPPGVAPRARPRVAVAAHQPAAAADRRVGPRAVRRADPRAHAAAARAAAGP